MNRRASTDGRARRWGRRLLRVVAGLLLSVLVLVALVLATVNLPWARARLARELSQLASEALMGTVSINRLGHIGFGSVTGIDAELLDTSGRSVLSLSDASVDLELTTLLRSLVGDAPLTVAFERIDLSRVEARLLEAPSGALSLLEAFEPTPSSAPETSPEGSSSAPPRWRFAHVTLEHASVQGGLGSFENLDMSLQDLTASGSIDGEAARFELQRVSVRASPLPVLGELEGRLSAAGQVDLDTPEGAPLGLNIRAQLSGAAAGIPFHARAGYADEQLAGYLDVRSSSSSLRRLWPDTAVEDPVSLFVGFDGTLEELRVLSVLESSAGELHVRGQLSLSPQVTGRLSVVGSGLDAGGWLSELPETSVQLAAALHFETEGGVRARVALRTWSSRWSGRELPELALSARLSDDEAEGTLRFAIAGASALIEAALSPLGPGAPEARKLHVRVAANVRDLARLASELELGEELRGELRLEGEVDLELQGLPSLTSGEVTATLHRVTAGPVAVRSAELRVSPRGRLQAPRFSLSLAARQLAVAGYPIRRLRAQGHGDLTELALGGRVEPQATAPIRFWARVFPTRQLARDVELVMLDGAPASASLRLAAERLALTPSGFEVQNLDVQGPVTGRLQLDASVRGRRIRVEGSATDFAPVVLARQLGLPLDVPRGVADLSVDVDYRPGRVSGRLRGGVTRFCMGELRGGKLDADLIIKDNVLQGSAAVRVPGLVQARLDASSLKLPPSWEPSQLSQVTGALEITASTDLAQLRAFAPSWLSASSRGRIQARVSVAGEPGDGYPKLRVTLSTEELAWSLPSDARPANGSDAGVVIQTESSTWQGMDMRLEADVVGSALSVSADIVDARGGLLATLQGSTRVALDRLLQSPERIDPRALPIELQLEVPSRRLEAFPAPLRFEGLDGSINAQVTIAGTVGRPALAGQLKLTDLQRQGGRALPVMILAGAKLRDEQLEVTADVHDEQRHLLTLQANAAVSGGGARPGLEQLELRLRSNGLPLESLGAALGTDVSGELYGSLHVRDLSAQPSAQGTLWINDPSVAGFRQNQARWVIDADASSFSTQLELRQPEGHARASASGPWQWGARLLPELQPAQTRLELEAKDFDLRALGALMPEQARALSGRLDADIDVGSGEERTVSGNVRLTEGTIYVGVLGQEFRDVRLDASVAPSGAVTIERLAARALSGRVSARGEAKLDGLMLRTARLVAEIPKNDPLPVMLEGVTVADAWGRFTVEARLEAAAESAQRTQHRLQIDVTVPRLHVILPEQAPQDVQALEEDPTIVTGTYLEPGHFLALPIPPYEDDELDADPSAPLLVNIEIDVGDDVWVERSSQLEVKLDGSVGLTLKEELSARGQLTLDRGTLDVRGRIFEIERGVITFAEERAPSNPTVVATARYTAPEGTEVYAEFVGPVETGTLSLRSEPPLRDDQILSLLLFGSPDGNFGASTGEGAVSGAALAAGGSVVTQGLNQELRRFTALDIQTRIGEREGQPQPEVVVQVSPRLSAELAYSVANANPGRAQDRTYLTLDLRLFRNWSLSTTIGDAGSLLVDLFWRYRY